ncbi:hypothetical protein Ae201684P_020431 [Aphanomyces euteiches]|nr:hypothetical protein Ae201684P_020431 [Aphanomyces euteiches]
MVVASPTSASPSGQPKESGEDHLEPPGPQIFSFQTVPDIDQSKLEPEVIVREGIDMTTEEIENQLAFIPEITPGPTSIHVDDLDFGEPDQPEEERAKMKAVRAKYMPFFIQSGNGLPPAARGAVCDIDVGSARPIAQRARRVRPEHLKQLFELLKGLLEYGLITFSKSPWAPRLSSSLRRVAKTSVFALTTEPSTICSLYSCRQCPHWTVCWPILMPYNGFYPSTTRVDSGLCVLHVEQGWMITNALYGFVDLPPGVAELDEDGEPRDKFKINYKYPEESMPPVANRTSFEDDISDGAETWDGIVELTDRILRRLTYFT